MASIEITEENPINVSLGEENTLTSSVSSPETVSVTSTDGWYEKKYEETDPIFEKSPASDITNEDIENWNNKSDFSGDYNDLENKPELFSGDYDDLENKPTIPTKTSDLTNDSGYSKIYYLSNDINNYTYAQISSLLNDGYEICLRVADYYVSAIGEPIANLVRCNQTLMDFAFVSAVYSETYRYTFANNTWSRETFDLVTDEIYDEIPYKTSQLTNDSGFLTEHQDISGKVDKETGKGLSTNDFTNAYKSNIDSNTTARHTHSNKSVLDDISSNDVSNWDSKQDGLISGTNIKTINNQSILGSGNITIQGGGSGDGDMLKSVYDTNDNGIVDNAEKVNNHTVGTDVPSNAVFTDTVYDDTSIRQELNDKADSSDIPTKMSDLTNDSGFITEHGIHYVSNNTSSNPFIISEHEVGNYIFKYPSIYLKGRPNDSGTIMINTETYQIKVLAKTTANNETVACYTYLEQTGGGRYITAHKVILKNGETDNANLIKDDYCETTNFPTIPTKTSDLTNDSGFLTQHQDISGKVDKENGKGLSSNDFTTAYKNNVDSNTSARHTHSNKSVLDGISSTDITNWNNKSTFSGSYNDLTDTPTIPTKTSDLTNDSSYIKATNYASNQTGGTIKTDTSTYGTSMYSGYLTGSTRTYAQYQSAANALFVSKGTLENVITGKQLASTSDIPTKVSDLTNDSGFLTSETDPTVPSWAKQNTKPSYQATEVSVDGSNLEQAGTSMVAIRSATETQEALRYISRAVKYNKEDIDTINNTSLPAKQDTLVSGTNIKTINSNSLLGSGDISFETIQDISESSVHIRDLYSGIYRIYGSCDVYYNSTGSLSVPSMAYAYLIVTECPDLYTINNWIFIGNGYPEFCYGYSWNNSGYCYNVTSKETQEAITGLLSNLTTTSKTNLVSAINELDSDKQDTLVSGTNIKTINGNSIVGSGDLDISVTGVDTRYATLWTGTWSSGSITVPNADKYYSFLVYVDGSRDPIPCYRDGNGNILGSVALGSASNSNNYVKIFRAGISGTTLTLNYARELAHYVSNNHNAGENKTIYKIVGLDPIASTGNVAVTDLENVIADYITERGESGGWHWTKYKSGKVELYGWFQYTGITSTSQSAGTYYGGSKTTNLPFAIKMITNWSAQETNSRSSGIYVYNISFSGGGTGTSTYFTIDFRGHASLSNASCGANIYINAEIA